MSLARYRYFEKVARLGSIREAAEVLHVAPSAISRQIAQLERDYASELFERGARGMNLTAAGEIVLRSARGLLDGIDQARSALDELHGLRRGHIRIFTVEGMMSDFVYPVLAAFGAAHPAITYELSIASSDQLLDRLVDDDADLAIAFNPPANRNVTTLATIPDPLVAVVAPDHEAAKRSSLALADLAAWRLALPDATFGLRRAVDESAAAAKVLLEPVLTTNSIGALRDFARTGMGLSILTGISIRREVEGGVLRAVPLSDPHLRSTVVGLCVRRERRLPAPVIELSRWLEAGASRLRRGQDVALSATAMPGNSSCRVGSRAPSLPLSRTTRNGS